MRLLPESDAANWPNSQKIAWTHLPQSMRRLRPHAGPIFLPIDAEADWQACRLCRLSGRLGSFDVRPWGDDSGPAHELLPYIDDVSLVDLVSGYEHAAGFDIPGAYAGVVLDHFEFGDLTVYLTGQPESAYWTTRGVIALLGCD
jgi:hypothetical protein